MSFPLSNDHTRSLAGLASVLPYHSSLRLASRPEQEEEGENSPEKSPSVWVPAVGPARALSLQALTRVTSSCSYLDVSTPWLNGPNFWRLPSSNPLPHTGLAMIKGEI